MNLNTVVTARPTQNMFDALDLEEWQWSVEDMLDEAENDNEISQWDLVVDVLEKWRWK
jgi:hypothetical protein